MKRKAKASKGLKDKEGLMQELMILGLLSHPNVGAAGPPAVRRAYLKVQEEKATPAELQLAMETVLKHFGISVLAKVRWRVLTDPGVVAGIRVCLNRPAIVMAKPGGKRGEGEDYPGSQCDKGGQKAVALLRAFEMFLPE